jgi:hypothetical protein
VVGGWVVFGYGDKELGWGGLTNGLTLFFLLIITLGGLLGGYGLEWWVWTGSGELWAGVVWFWYKNTKVRLVCTNFNHKDQFCNLC